MISFSTILTVTLAAVAAKTIHSVLDHHQVIDHHVAEPMSTVEQPDEKKETPPVATRAVDGPVPCRPEQVKRAKNTAHATGVRHARKPEEILVLEDRPEPQDKPIAPMSALRKGLLGAGDACRAKGDMEKAIACYSRVAHKVPSAYFDIAEIYANEHPGNLIAQKYAKLGERNAKKSRQCAKRRARIRAERRRIGAANAGWMHAA